MSKKRQVVSGLIKGCIIILALLGFAQGRSQEEPIAGYWEITDSENRLSGVVKFTFQTDQIQAYGVRLNVLAPKYRLSWVCDFGDSMLADRAVWAGPLLYDMQRSEQDFLYYYGGSLLSAVGCQVWPARLVFDSQTSGQLIISQEIDFYDFEKNFIFDRVFALKKISMHEALQGCQYIIGPGEMQAWGDLVNNESARQSMLDTWKITREDWQQLVNKDQICMNHI